MKLRSRHFAPENHCDEIAGFRAILLRSEGGRAKGGLTVWVQEIWRYPVKSMAGESLGAADLTEAGVAGDRIMQVRNASGRIISARTRPLLLRHRATLSSDNQVRVDGRPWIREDVARDVEAHAGVGTRLVQSDSKDRLDIIPLLVVCDMIVVQDPRLFLPHLVVGGGLGLAEQQWEGARLRIGPVVIGMEDLRTRCIMTTFDPDSGEQNLGVLERIRKEFNAELGLNSFVVAPGRISVGDAVELIPPS